MTPPLALRIYNARLQLYVGALVGSGVLTGSLLLLAHRPVGTMWVVAALALAAAMAERASVRLTSNTEESISLLPTLFAAVLFGPLAAMIVGAASMLGDPGALWARRSRATTASQVGRLHEHARAGWCRGGCDSDYGEFGHVEQPRISCNHDRSQCGCNHWSRYWFLRPDVQDQDRRAGQGGPADGRSHCGAVDGTLDSRRGVARVRVSRNLALDTPALLRSGAGRP